MVGQRAGCGAQCADLVDELIWANNPMRGNLDDGFDTFGRRVPQPLRMGGFNIWSCAVGAARYVDFTAKRRARACVAGFVYVAEFVAAFIFPVALGWSS